MPSARGGHEPEAGPPERGDRIALFAALWALAALFHVWVNPFSQRFFGDPSWLGASHVALAVTALAVLWWPRSRPLLTALAVFGLWSWWLEAPTVGNHWLLAAFVNLGILVALVAARPRFAAAFVPVAQATLVAFYAFAAFAKLNHAFVDRRVSCSVFFGDDLARSLHLDFLSPSGTGAAALALPWVVIAIEVAIPVLLVLRRTRVAGVALGLAYHSLIAVDSTHLFGDFSSVLAALFLLFLPPAFAVDTLAYLRERRAQVDAARAVLTIASAAVLVSLWLARGELTRRVFVDGRYWTWIAVDVAVLFLAGRLLLRRSAAAAAAAPERAGLAPRWLAVVPALVVLNGLTPYLEIKTAYGWNMYSNLRTVAGESNHFLVRATLPLTDAQEDFVRIRASNDRGLDVYATQGYDLPFQQLRAYLSERPDVSLAYGRGGRLIVSDPARNDPELVRPVARWQRRLFAFRAVDQRTPPRCQPAFLPAH